MEPRCYPTGNMPSPSVLLQAANEPKIAHRTNTDTSVWRSFGPHAVPGNHNGIGRVNCIVFDPIDTAIMYIGTACGGVWISHNGGYTWASSTDRFPSLSIADIAVNPRHNDTLYAATGDGYGYANGSFDIFWGGLYSAGVMRSTDGGSTWGTTGLSFMQNQRFIVQKLLIHPRKTSTLIAATTFGICRSQDAGNTWDTVYHNHVYSMALKPGQPDTIYAVDTANLLISYDAGATWNVQCAGVNTTGDRCTIAVSPISSNSVWLLNVNDNLMRSYNMGRNFYATSASPSSTANFYGYYDRVLAVSPGDSNTVIASGMNMAITNNAGNTWTSINATTDVHVDNHAFAFNPLRPQTVFSGNDGGIAASYDGGNSWQNMADGLTISQIYKLSVSVQNPNRMQCGLQDNGTFYCDSVNWWHTTGGDGMDNAINPISDFNQINSWQYGHFYISWDQGASFAPVALYPDVAGNGPWVTPVAWDPANSSNVYFGFNIIYKSVDAGSTATPSSSAVQFTNGAQHICIAPSKTDIVFACDYNKVIRTGNGGTTWTNISPGLPSGAAKTNIAVDYRDTNVVYISYSGYASGLKVYKTINGGRTWTNFSDSLPNVPVNCLATDSTTPGAIFAGTDMGVYYRDDSSTYWKPYKTGLPNVIVDDIDINYTDYKIHAATYGRGVWECGLKKAKPVGITPIGNNIATLPVTVSPNPATKEWNITFSGTAPTTFTTVLRDLHGKIVGQWNNEKTIPAEQLSKGNYVLTITTSAGKSKSLMVVKE